MTTILNSPLDFASFDKLKTGRAGSSTTFASLTPVEMTRKWIPAFAGMTVFILKLY